jgi:FKBP-type peptidyl-prolyl cis-trans isomerase FkpA
MNMLRALLIVLGLTFSSAWALDPGLEALVNGKRFMEENGRREGVKTTASGLQYEVLQAGEGPKPKATDTVTVHYQGGLITGDIFDSSYQRGEPISFSLSRVIKGWTEVLQLMPVGTKVRAVIPPKLAYGERGMGGKIGPGETLVFDIELLGIKPLER